MMDLSLAGLIGAVIGTIVAALAYVPLVTFVERGLRSRASAGSADERESFERRPLCCAGPCSRPTSSCLRASATGLAG
jgi:hypothetical protein